MSALVRYPYCVEVRVHEPPLQNNKMLLVTVFLNFCYVPVEMKKGHTL